jgi:serine/threonine-protein kinase RsbW
VSEDEIRLAFPAAPEYARIARLTVAGLATRMGFTYDEVEDLRIALGEACSMLIGTDGVDGDVTITYRLGADRITVEAQGPDGIHPVGEEENLRLSEAILGGVVDDHAYDQERRALRFSKHRAPV